MMMRLIKAADVTHMTQRLHYSSSADWILFIFTQLNVHFKTFFFWINLPSFTIKNLSVEQLFLNDKILKEITNLTKKLIRQILCLRTILIQLTTTTPTTTILTTTTYRSQVPSVQYLQPRLLLSGFTSVRIQNKWVAFS